HHLLDRLYRLRLVIGGLFDFRRKYLDAVAGAGFAGASGIGNFADLLDANLLSRDPLNIGDFDDIVDNHLVHDIDPAQRLGCVKYASEPRVTAADNGAAKIDRQELGCRDYRPVAIGIT